VSDGQLAAVMDFGTCGAGDPAWDLAIAWTLLIAEGRQVFRERPCVAEAVLAEIFS
jgi:aminoglycoside phosphotransferase (APT) family kinase protein